MGTFSKQVLSMYLLIFQLWGMVKFRRALFFYYLFMKLFNPFINPSAML